MSRIVVLIAATWCFFACLAETPAEVFNQILDCESDFDSAEDFAESTGVSFSTRYSQEISTSGLEEDQFLASFRSHCTNLAFSVAGDPLDDSWRRFNAALDVLSRYDTNHFPILLSDD